MGSGSDSDSEIVGMTGLENHGGSQTSFFEGVEKLLEVWFTRTDGKIADCDLRNIPRDEIEGLLELVKCEVISTMANDYLDSYVLSESSLFVSKRRFILKTCGTTTTLKCLRPLFMLVEEYAGFDKIEDIFYSRKNFKRPDLQILPHRNFDDEVHLLDSFFAGDGGAYCMGTVNRDCWYLYTLNPLSIGRGDHHSSPLGLGGLGGMNMIGGTGVVSGGPEPDQTLEILMTELDPKIMSIFTKKVCQTGKEATMRSGIDKIIPNAIINDHLFEPCGYSMNGIFKNSENGLCPNGSYVTIHITPEEEYSYVSFETNVPQNSYFEIILRVLECFQPQKFVLTFFSNKASPGYKSQSDLEKLVTLNKQWVRIDSQHSRFKNYDLIYALYNKFPS